MTREQPGIQGRTLVHGRARVQHRAGRRVRSIVVLLGATSLAGLLSFGWHERALADETSCKREKFTFWQVKLACKKGGIPEAEKLMKKAMQKAKDQGQTFKCITCHQNEDTYELKPDSDAAEKLRPFL